MKKLFKSVLIAVLLLTIILFYGGFHVHAYGAESQNSTTILKDFLMKTQFADDNKDYDSFFQMWSGKTFEDLYLKINGNTESKWNDMTLYEKACYGLLVTYPKMFILGDNNTDNATDYNTLISKLDSYAKEPLSNLKRGDEFYNAITKVWNWHWQNWYNQRRFINLFENTKIIRISKIRPAPSSTTNYCRDLSLNNSSFLAGLIGNYSLTILIILIFGIVLISLKIKHKKKKEDNI